jgi:glycosyltransferase involved in cell wall biosynthesis
MKILLLVPGLYDRKGGIQAFSRFLRDAVAPEHDIVIVSKHDRCYFGGAECIVGCGRIPECLRTGAFVICVLWCALKLRPDLVLATHIHFSPLFRILKLLGRAKHWAVAHGVEAWEITAKRVAQGLEECDKILAVSEVTRSRMIQQQYASAQKIEVLYNRADESRFFVREPDRRDREQLGIADDTKVLLFVGRLDAAERYKGYDNVVEAMAILRRPDIVFLVVGDGNDRARLEELVTGRNLNSQVRFLGAVSDEELPKLYSIADLFVMPSQGEGFGIVFLEAMLSGTPCIGGRSDGAAEALQQGALGVLVDSTDVNDLALAITDSLRSTTLLRGTALREAALEVFGEAIFERRVKELLSNLYPEDYIYGHNRV